MKQRFLTLILCCCLAACGGIPLSALPRLAQLSGRLLDADPAQFRVALQVDKRLVPPPGAVPHLVIQLAPRTPGAFAPVDERLPMVMTTSAGATLGLEPPGPGRRWLIYSLPDSTQAELRRIQNTVHQAQAQPGYQRGGTLSMGVEQHDLAVDNPALDQTRWDTWLQVNASEGFFEIWRGTPAQVKALATKQR